MKTRYARTLAVIALVLFFAAVTAQTLPGIVDVAQRQADYGFRVDLKVPRWQTFAPQHDKLTAVELLIGSIGEAGNLVVELRSPKGKVLARVKQPVKNGWLRLVFSKPVPVKPGELYKIYVYTDRVSPNARNRAFWRGFRSASCCPNWPADVSGGWPSFRYAFVVYAAK